MGESSVRNLLVDGGSRMALTVSGMALATGKLGLRFSR